MTLFSAREGGKHRSALCIPRFDRSLWGQWISKGGPKMGACIFITPLRSDPNPCLEYMCNTQSVL